MEAIVAGAVRLPLGSLSGALKEIHVADLGAEVLRQTLKRSGKETSAFEEVILGDVVQSGTSMNPSAPTCDQGRHRPGRSFLYRQ